MARRPAGTPRVVFDTNVIVSALVFEGGTSRSLRTLWQAEDVLPLVSTHTASELVRVLHYPRFRLTGEEREELLSEYLPWCETVRIPSPPPRTPSCRDPWDVPFLELAIAGRADLLVSGDADLHAVQGVKGFAVLTVAALLHKLRKD